MVKTKLTFQEHVLQQLEEDERVQFVFFYRQNCKNIGIAYLWLIFLGVFGMHKFYLNKRSGWLYLLFSWSLIPAILTVIDVFLLPFQVRNYNRNLSINIFDLIKKHTPSSANLLLIDRKLASKRIKLIEWVLAIALIFAGIFPAIAYSSMRLTAHRLEIHYKTNHLDGSQSDSYLTL